MLCGDSTARAQSGRNGAISFSITTEMEIISKNAIISAQASRLPSARCGRHAAAAYNRTPGMEARAPRCVAGRRRPPMNDDSDHDPQETREWLDALDGVLANEGAGPRAIPDRSADRQGAALGRLSAVLREHRVHQHDPGRQAGAASRAIQTSSRTHSLTTSAGTRWRWCCAPTRTRTSAATSRASPRRRRSTTSASTISGMRRRTDARRRSRLRAGPFRARRLCARVHARPLHGRADGQFPAGSRRQGHLVLSASVADAGLLAVPHGVDGPRPADGDLPGALHEVSAGPRPRQDRGTQGVGFWATARWTSPSRWARSAWRRARTSTT